MKTIAMTELKKHTDHLTPQEIVLDVRSPEEFREGHIPGATNIPLPELSRHVSELKKYRSIYIHCRSGGRATVAAYELQRAGLNSLVCVSGGGMPDWEAAGLPVER